MTDALNAPEATEAAEASGISRRSVVRTGAHLAWAVPAVQLVTSAPALAASGTKPNLTGGSIAVGYNKARTQTSVAIGAVRNTGGDMKGQLTASVSLPGFLKSPKLVGKPSAGWKAVGKSGRKLTFISTSSGLATGASTKKLSFKVSHKAVKKAPAGKITAIVRGTGDSITSSATLPKVK